jgi:hypothetical protein
MPSAFDLDTAHFSAMMPGQIAIDKVFHKATLEFTEEGTVAAAATQVSLALCLAKGTPVLTPAGEKPIEQLRPGDFVLARDEGNLEGDVRPKRVEAVSSNVGAVLEIHVRGQIIRATTNHPFFVKKRGWTPTEELKPGDLLLTHSSGWIAIDDIKNPNATVDVYNLRVADDRTYFVGSAKWGFAVWVHNDACIPEFDLNREFDVIIRDNATSTILFMGRISDPSQLQNSVSPTFVAPNADFDGNLRVDGQDFLAWQRGSGKLNGATADTGDADHDGDVDRTDLGYWRAGFRPAYRPPSMALLAAATNPLSQDKASFESLSAALRDMALVLNWAVYDSQPDNAQLTDNPQPAEDQLADELLEPTFKDFAAAFSDPSFSPVPGRPATVQGPTPNQTGQSPSSADPTVEWQSLADVELGL